MSMRYRLTALAAMFPLPHLFRLSALLFASVCLDAGAMCPIFTPQVYVGDKFGSDPSCDYNDIQSAITAVGSCPIGINITREHTYTSQHLSIDGKALSLVGWGDGITCQSLKNFCPIGGCSPSGTLPLLTIDGSHTAGSVLSISGNSSVALRYLTISGGQTPDDSNGGGINFTGAGILALDTSTVTNNYAGYGGGISVTASGGNAKLNLLSNTLIDFNTAQVSGGGIRIEGDTQLSILGDETLIGYNQALDGYGGGIEVLGPARADIGSPGFGGLGVIYSNDAPRGGGIAAFGSGDTFFGKPGIVNLFTTDPARPVRVQGNFASIAGGAFYGKGHVDQENNQNVATFCASHFRIDENAAPDGAAVFLDWDTSIANPDLGSNLLLNVGACGGGALSCAEGVPCNVMSDNVAEDSLGNPTNGAVVLVGSDSTFQADGLVMRNNRAAQLINIVGDSYSNYRGPGLLHNCLLADNQTNQDLLDITAEKFTIDNCTIAGNSIGGTWVFPYVDNLTNSLIFQSGTSVGNVGTTIQYILSSDITHLPHDATVQQLFDPKFVDAGGGDYHLRATSPAVDFAGGLGGYDLDNQPRDRDLPSVPNKFGPRDLGAFELQHACGASDTIFCNDFEP